ncbi:hypothetical protein LguiA_033505 [Lonicera macranthoides]
MASILMMLTISAFTLPNCLGVLGLETVSGQRNNSFRNRENVEDLLSYVSLDKLARTRKYEFDRPIIVLLCIQENVADRPTMASIALMLSSFSLTLLVPSEPAFFRHSSVVDPEKPLFG